MKSRMKKLSMWGWTIASSIVLCTFGFAQELSQVDGQVYGFTDIKTDGLVDGAVVLPSLSPQDLFQFQVEQFMGPSEEMSVAGVAKVKVPSNFYIPYQKEKYGFIPVGFSKEHFSIFVNPGDPKELIAAWFQVPWKSLMAIKDGAPPTSILPGLVLKKHGYLESQDWATESEINFELNRPLSKKISYEWNRGPVKETEMDSMFLFQATKTLRWAFVNVKGNPEQKGELASAQGLEDNFKILFMRTRNNEDGKVSAGEGHIRSGGLGDTVKVKGIPPALNANLASADRVSWEPIHESGWMSLVVSQKKPSNRFFEIENIFGGVFARSAREIQQWVKPDAGTASTGLNSLSGANVALAFIGTSVDVPKPDVSTDNSQFIEAASEIRMKKLK